jgi:hypothetical protein
MPTIRVGFSSDFILKNNTVGLGTTSATGSKLDVDGAIRGNFNVTGVATLTSYGGFIAQRQYINKSSTIGFATVGLNTAGAAIGVGATHVANQYYETETGFTDLGGVHHGDDQFYNTLSEDLVIDDGQILNITNVDMVGVTTIGEYDPHTHASHVIVGSLEQVSVTDHFSVPNGGINERRSFIEGTVRFNTDLSTLEFFNGVEWKQFTYNQGQSGRGVYGGGRDPATTEVMGYINIHSLGNAQYFGDLSVSGRQNPGACASSIRGLWGGGQPDTSVIDYITLASTGNAIDFGNLSSNRYLLKALSSSTRGVWAGGWPGSSNVIDYVEIPTLGNALDFGDMTVSLNAPVCTSSPTRGIIAGGRTPSVYYSHIDSITIASKGNAVDTGGDLISKTAETSACSNGTRGVIMGGQIPDLSTQCMILTIASNGNAVYFGDLSEANSNACAAGTNTRGVHIGGRTPLTPSVVNTMEYITYTSLGNAQDFGDMTIPTKELDATSDSHGGLGGF